MTASERLTLIDSIGEIECFIEKARYLHDEIANRFFTKDPTQQAGVLAICYDFKRYAAFHDMLGDLLSDVVAHLPATYWLEALKVEDEEAPKS